MSLPKVEKTFRCSTCKKDTAHTLEPIPTGAEWVCTDCKSVLTKYSRDDMQRVVFAVAKALGGATTAPTHSDLPDTTDLRVFIEGASGPVELDPRFVQRHVELVGKLPRVGEPLYTSYPGLPAPFSVVPYGKVVRLTHEKDDP